MHGLASALALLRVCSIERLSVQLDVLSDGDPLQWITCLQQQRQREPLPGISPLRQLRLSNEDCLYVFATLILEQFRWEPAPRCEQERMALFLAFRDLGQALNIHAIPCTIEALECFQHQYEGQHCCYAACNERISRAIGDGLMGRLPWTLHPLGYVGISTLLDEHRRAALGLPCLHPSWCSMVRWVITTYQHRIARTEQQSAPLGQHVLACDHARQIVEERRSDPVEFLVWTLCSARFAPPIVMNEPEGL
ncbi:hypothetical protein KSF_065280 [Reticulibacter mediterranei]|uniref:Uncharacterized protein n=1 Tax=Reticulibacter mediterranei TaxID=2778369 RepID=A0A8J3IT80_9CHLR|nr:hypothetical protein [Reticulibacter mediterranei]GHO96480.1 hypothetical protein KSF_065280 [Reticulibacter mediterranei]